VTGSQYVFRVRCKLSTGWDDFSSPSAPIEVLSLVTLQLPPPTLVSRDTTSVTIEWNAPNEKEEYMYNLRYREEDSLEWTYVSATLKNTQVRKKGLHGGINYYFSVLPVPVSVSKDEQEDKPDDVKSVFSSDQKPAFEYSLQSLPCQVQQFSSYMSNLFPKQLLSWSGSKVDTSACLAGKMVAIYFSAHWCPPCRQFTPVLGNVYNALKAAGKTDKFEVVFCSADHSEEEFQSYFKSMAPWSAIDYDDDERESFMGTFKVQGIPKLVVMAPDGKIIADNAVNAGFSVEMVGQWMKQCNL
jgi:thiol-disulfide isomerase/thioredoxin